MFRKLLSTSCITAFLFLLCGATFAQSTGSISGKITESDTGQPLPGANIYIVELNRGASSDADGNFLINNVPVGTYTVQATFVGYKRIDQQYNVESGNNTLNLKLEPEFVGLNEVVVTALGIKRKERAIGYSVQEVGGETIENSQQANLVNALAGKVAGVQITSSSGQPGASSRIVIRGNSSLLGNNQPLFIVDGIPISNAEDASATAISDGTTLFTGGTSNRGLDIDPSIIENVSVLKGASATALYGSRAANGAIIITTKDGQRGQPARVSLNSSVGWADAITDGYQDQYLEGLDGYYANGLPVGRGGYTEPGYPTSGGGTPNPQTTRSWGPKKDEVSEQVLNDLGVDNIQTYDPRKQFYQTGLTLKNSINLSGGTEQSNYFFSANNSHQTGIVPETKLDRTSLMGKFGSQLGERINVSTSINYTNTANNWAEQGNGPHTYLFGLNFTPINFNLKPSTFEDGTQRLNTTGYNNPFWLVENNGYTSSVDRFISSSNAKIDLNSWLTISERIGIDTYNDTRKGKTNIGTRGTPEGSMSDEKITRTQINSDLTLTANKDLNQDFNLEVLLGNNINSRYYNYDISYGQDLNIPDFFHISNASVQTADQYTEKVRLYSFYGQATLDYKDYVYLTLTGRNDWSSTLPKDNNSYFYPSASVGFVFTDAFDVFRNTFLSYGKIRASVSQIGNDADPYSTATNFTQANPGDGVRGNIDYPLSNGTNGYQLSNVLGNPDLKPEITTEYEVGLDLQLFRNRASLDFSYYDRTSKNQIFQVPVSPTTGFAAKLGNAGSINNSGIEISAGVTPVQTNDFRWDVNLNFAKNTTKVVRLAEGVDNIFLDGFTDPQIRIDKENGYGVIWGTYFEKNEEGQTLIGDDGLPISTGEFGAIGNVQPDWTGNLRTTFSYKGISLSALFDEKHGGDILNMDLYYSTYYGTAKVTEQRGTQMTDPDQPGYVEPLVYDGVNNNTGEPNTTEVLRDRDYYQNFYSFYDQNLVEDGSFIKLREISLSYTLPQSLISRTPIHSLTVTGTGYNLWIDSDFSYGDPEGNLTGSGNAQGFYHGVTPSTRSYTLGVKVSF